MMHRVAAIATRVPGRLEQLINKAGLSALHLHGISRPNGRFMESDISGTDRALIKFSTLNTPRDGERLVKEQREREEECVGISLVERDPRGTASRGTFEQACHDSILALA